MLTITTTHNPATDIGYLLHKHPEKLQTFDLSFGKAHVFYPEASEERCTAALILDVDPIDLTRRSRKAGSTPESLLQAYVNDRPYTASSHLSVAIAKVYGTAMSGKCNEKPDLATSPIPLEVKVASVRSRRGQELITKLFEPLGYQVNIETLPMDPMFPSWGEGNHHNLTLSADDKTLSQLLTHLYVLLPALDNQKHYWINEDEIEKLLRFGDGWLDSHPARHTISRRYLGHRRNLFAEAQAQFDERARPQEEDPQEEDPQNIGPDTAQEDGQTSIQSEKEQDLERPMSLNSLRMQAVLQEVRNSGATSVLDLGCGEGHFIKQVLNEPQLKSITGLEVSMRALGIAERRIKPEQMTPDMQAKLNMLQGSLIYRDTRLKEAGAAIAAVAIEVVEHIDPPKLDAFEDAILEYARPQTLIVTTPNHEYNVLFPDLKGPFRHRDHRFEWTRAEFQEWAQAAAGRRGYSVAFKGVGQEDETRGAPTQMAVFTRKSKTDGEKASTEQPETPINITPPENKCPQGPQPATSTPFRTKLAHEMNHVLAANGYPVKLNLASEENSQSLADEARRANIAARHAVKEWAINSLHLQGLTHTANQLQTPHDWLEMRNAAFDLATQTKGDMPKIAADAIHLIHSISGNLCHIHSSENPDRSRIRTEWVANDIAKVGETFHRTILNRGGKNNLIHQFHDLLDRLD